MKGDSEMSKWYKQLQQKFWTFSNCSARAYFESGLWLIQYRSCWENENSCSGKPNQCGPFKGDEKGILNSLVLKRIEIDWPDMYSLIVSFEMEDWRWSINCNNCTFIGWKYQAAMAAEKN